MHSFKKLLVVLVLGGGVVATAEEAAAPAAVPAPAADLSRLVEPVALHDDALLEVVLAASCYPDQLHAAASYARATSRPFFVVNQHESIEQLLNHRETLFALDDNLDHTRSLGESMTSDPESVRRAVAAVRAREHAAGRLASNAARTVGADAQGIRITALATPAGPPTMAHQPAADGARRPPLGTGHRPLPVRAVPQPRYDGGETRAAPDTRSSRRRNDPLQTTTIHNPVILDRRDTSPPRHPPAFRTPPPDGSGASTRSGTTGATRRKRL